MKTHFFRILSIALITTAIVITVLMVSMAAVEPMAHIYPDYPMADIEPVLQKDSFTDEDYWLLYLQTGLGKPAVDEIKELYDDWDEHLLRYQQNFFKKIGIICEKNSLISREESIIDESGNYINGTDMASIHEGDILITKSSHTYGWRNSHAALVVDVGKGETLESVVLGQNSSIQHISKWTNYPNFMLLRPKGATYEEMKQIAITALELLHDIPYDLTVGIFGPKSADKDKIKGTHCSTSDLAGIQVLWL